MRRDLSVSTVTRLQYRGSGFDIRQRQHISALQYSLLTSCEAQFSHVLYGYRGFILLGLMRPKGEEVSGRLSSSIADLRGGGLVLLAVPF
jgi:hypothetical protein